MMNKHQYACSVERRKTWADCSVDEKVGIIAMVIVFFAAVGGLLA